MPATVSTANPSQQIKLDLITRAREVQRGKHTLSSAQLKELYEALENYDQFAYAAEILLVKMDQDEKAGIRVATREFETLAKFIYKDHSLPSGFKFEKALQVIGSHIDLEGTTAAEALGLTAAVFKRKWQFDHQYKNLVLAAYYYRRGYENWKTFLQAGSKHPQDPRNDEGYTAVNYAYVAELMSMDKLEETATATGITPEILDLLKEATTARAFIIRHFTGDSADQPLVPPGNPDHVKWIMATLAEASFGNRHYAPAKQYIAAYLQQPGLKPWEIRSFQQQLFSIAYLQVFLKDFLSKTGAARPGIGQLAEQAAGIDADQIKACLSLLAPGGGQAGTSFEISKGGKLGLALSGGGFRASLFHIGVLAGLAEKDELRHVQVISCVSGGSIIGAFYYLKLKTLLESKPDMEIEAADYIRIVQDIEKEFLLAVQKNLRMRVFSNLFCSAKMLVSKNYSRTHRLGELYENLLYKKLWPKEGPICMDELYITPAGAGGKFDLSVDNWVRKNKIPQLVLNATTVNTGHNWQFTASWMGEPPGNIQTDIDVKPRLRRMYYAEAPDPFKKFRLGFAVGASSCVPVMFHPMPLHGLYPEVDVQLIDGGLHDNQGIAALIDAECKNMIISDGSGQLPTSIVASNNEAATFYRADSILQERLRELQFLDIRERAYTTQINTLLTTHLKKDLQSGPISWKYCKDPERKIVYGNQDARHTDLTSYGILREVQALLAEVRTDLDSFNDLEATSLMYSGYAQIHFEYKNQYPATSDPDETLWQFAAVKPLLTNPEDAASILRRLATARKLAFKAVYLSMPLRLFLIVSGIAAAAGLLYLGYLFWTATLLTITVKTLVYTFIGFLLALVSKFIAALFSYKATLRKYAGMLLMMIFAWIFCNLYLWLVNPIYNHSGLVRKKDN